MSIKDSKVVISTNMKSWFEHFSTNMEVNKYLTTEEAEYLGKVAKVGFYFGGDTELILGALKKIGAQHPDEEFRNEAINQIIAVVQGNNTQLTAK